MRVAIAISQTMLLFAGSYCALQHFQIASLVKAQKMRCNACRPAAVIRIDDGAIFITFLFM
jgi:hypothetical protein